ncbi:acyltransferase [Flavobacterium amniphilum]|uniref:acyltransferase family protein n=1 Tax=Flavobacterium amniphilum TaxID=1834035 RepID=UPI00202AB89B|nr:acyltransferase [Flavobacterium amniphilum]MCL9807564.1 acyltransferase [Flavobacterium amniphilum]
MYRLPNLTSIRFFLASFVVLFHLPEYCINRGFPYFNDFPLFFRGTEAVYAFFSLSGFLIIRNLFLEKKGNKINLKKFYLRRMLRIFPLYYLVFFIGLIFYHLIAPKFGYIPDPSYNIATCLALGLTFFPNILATYKPGGIIEVLWSIGIEEQFYLFIAPVIYYLKAKSSFIFLILFTIIYFYFSHYSIINKTLLKYGMYFYFFSFSGIMAYISLKKDFSKITKLVPYTSFSITILVFFTDILKSNLDSSMYNMLCMANFSITIYFLSLQPIKPLENNTLKQLGEISYGIYMYHPIVFQFMGFVYLKSGIHYSAPENVSVVVFYFSVFIFTLLISYFSYHFFEKKFLKLKTY